VEGDVVVSEDDNVGILTNSKKYNEVEAVDFVPRKRDIKRIEKLECTKSDKSNFQNHGMNNSCLRGEEYTISDHLNRLSLSPIKHVNASNITTIKRSNYRPDNILSAFSSFKKPSTKAKRCDKLPCSKNNGSSYTGESLGCYITSQKDVKACCKECSNGIDDLRTIKSPKF
jgi:hypothetical protein